MTDSPSPLSQAEAAANAAARAAVNDTRSWLNKSKYWLIALAVAVVVGIVIAKHL